MRPLRAEFDPTAESIGAMKLQSESFALVRPQFLGQLTATIESDLDISISMTSALQNA